jgi:hypothetical protein
MRQLPQVLADKMRLVCYAHTMVTDPNTSQPLTLSAIADHYQVNVGKPHFPLNTLRLVYLVFAESIAPTSPELVNRRTEDILKLIPLVQTLLDARSAHRSANAEQTLEAEWTAVQEPLHQIYHLVNTYGSVKAMEHIFSYVFPLQDTLLLSLYNDLAVNKQFTVQDIYTIFHIRSMDSVLYSSLVGEIIARDTDPHQLPDNFQLALHYKLNALYQLNDLVDSIVYAKEDMDSKNFSPFELIRKAATNAQEGKTMITSIATAFEKRIQTFALGDETERMINDFGHQLVNVISKG